MRATLHIFRLYVTKAWIVETHKGSVYGSKASHASLMSVSKHDRASRYINMLLYRISSTIDSVCQCKVARGCFYHAPVIVSYEVDT